MNRRLPLLATVLLAGCAAAFAQAPQSPAPVDLRITKGEVAPELRRIPVRQGEQVRLRITSDTPGQLQVQAYRMQASLGPGSVVNLSFTAKAAGRFPITWHAAGAAAGSPEGPPLAMLEVSPR